MSDTKQHEALMAVLNLAASHLAEGVELATKHRIKVEGLTAAADHLAVALDNLADKVAHMRERPN